jgi:hypothetical protein
LQILSLNLFEKTPTLPAFEGAGSQEDLVDSANQRILFDF